MLAIFGVVGAAFAAFMFIDTDDEATTEAEVASAPETPDVPNVSLDEMLALYAWHCDHHLGHVTELKAREGWA